MRQVWVFCNSSATTSPWHFTDQRAATVNNYSFFFFCLWLWVTLSEPEWPLSSELCRRNPSRLTQHACIVLKNLQFRACKSFLLALILVAHIFRKWAKVGIGWSWGILRPMARPSWESRRRWGEKDVKYEIKTQRERHTTWSLGSPHQGQPSWWLSLFHNLFLRVLMK